LPILDEFLRRMRLEDFLRAALPPEDRRTKLSPVKGLGVLLRNLLVSREPIYGMGDWAARHAPDALGITAGEVESLNDDGVGRALDRLFAADVPSLVLAVATHVVKEFDVSLDELHNDSTTITFCGAYANADGLQRYLGRPPRFSLRRRLQVGHQRKHGAPPSAAGPIRHRAAAHPHGRRRVSGLGRPWPSRLADAVGQDRRERRDRRQLLDQ
jgi:hypothetical protein